MTTGDTAFAQRHTCRLRASTPPRRHRGRTRRRNCCRRPTRTAWGASCTGRRRSRASTPDAPTQVIDVRDLAGWLLACGQAGTTGTYNAVCPVLAFGEWIAFCRQVGGHTGPVMLAPGSWLLEQGVEEYMGEDSQAMWVEDPDMQGWSSRSGGAAVAAGLRHLPRETLLREVLAYEREQGLDRPRAAGLGPARERNLLTTLADEPTSG